MSRRDLLRRFISLSFGALSLLFTGIVLFVYPKRTTGKILTYLPVLEEHELPKRLVKKVEYRYEHKGQDLSNRFYITPSDNGFIALSPVCTHLGCLVNWDSINKEFICPCHGGRYDRLGNVIEGPPSRPLERMPLKISGEKVYLGIYL